MVFRLGAILLVLGFGSAFLHFTDVQFKALMWAEPAQPALGLILGIGGVVAIGAGVASNNKEKHADAQPSGAWAPPRPQPQPQQVQQAQPPYGQPPQQMAAQQYPHRGPVPPPHGDPNRRPPQGYGPGNHR